MRRRRSPAGDQTCSSEAILSVLAREGFFLKKRGTDDGRNMSTEDEEE